MNTNNNAHSFVVSNNPQEEFYRVLSALSTVFNVPTTPHAGESSSSRNNNIPIDLSNREDADRYLTQFQRSPVAWMVADRLLSSTSHNDPQVQFFAAQTLHTKCRADILQLEFHQLNSLRDSLMDSLMKFISHGGAGVKAIVTRLAMAICCLALQMKWESIMDDLLTSLQQQQQQSQQHMVEMVLIIAKILPEEVNSERVLLPNEQQRFIFVEKLVHSSEKMLQFLFYCASTAGGNDSERVKIQEQVLRCLHSWVRYVNIPPSLLQNRQLVDFTFAILQANDYKVYGGDLFELSVDVIIEILRCYPSDNPDNMGLVQKFIPLIMDLGLDSHSPFQKALRQEDEDSMRDYCRIFTEMGESYMSLIVHHEDLNQVKLVNLVLACSAIPDNDIATITLHFWYRFVSCLEDMEPYEYRQLQIDNFTPQIITLVSTCTSLLRYPADIDTLSADRIDDLDRNRFYVNDTLEDCCRLLGGDMVLRTIGKLLQTEVERLSFLGGEGLKQWHTIEACFKALISTSRYIPHDESNILPFVMNLVPSLPTSVRFLRKTANLMVGAFAEWLNRHYDHLQPILPFLSQGLSDSASASSAAVAIKQLCENSNSQVALGDSVLHLYDGIVAAQLQQHSTANVPIAPILDTRDELEVLEGACKAVSRQLEENLLQDPTSSSSLEYINRIVEPIGTRLVQYSSTTTRTGPKQVVAELERLTVVIRYLNIPNRRAEFLIDLMTQCWPYLEMISSSFTDFQMAEKVCRLHKHCLRNCGVSAYKPLFEKLCIHLVQNFSHSRQSPYLYAASVVISEFGRDADAQCQKQLYTLLEEMGKVSFQLLHSAEQFKNHPDVVEELFFCASRMIQYCPEIFVASHIFHPFVQCATVGMTQHHKDANRGSMTFLDHVFSFGLTIQACSIGSGSDIGGIIRDCQQSIETLLSKEGQVIVTNLILSLIGEWPCYRITSNNGSVAGVLYKLYRLCPNMVMDWMTAPLNRVSKTEQTLLINAFRSNVSKDELCGVCERFVEVCSRSQRMGSAYS